MPSLLSKKQGFTLLEIIIALSILGVMIVSAYSGLWGIMRSREVVSDKSELRSMANAILSRMSREIQLASESVTLMPAEDDLETVYAPKVYLKGDPGKGEGGHAGDRIRFMAFEAGQHLSRGPVNAGLVQIIYEAKESGRDQKISRSGETGLSLVRTEVPFLRPYTRAYQRKMTFPIVDNLVSLRFRYYNSEPDRWEESWGDGELIGLPAMIKMTVELRSPAGKIESYTTAVPLRRRL